MDCEEYEYVQYGVVQDIKCNKFQIKSFIIIRRGALVIHTTC